MINTRNYRHDFLKNLSLFLFIGVHRRSSAAKLIKKIEVGVLG